MSDKQETNLFNKTANFFFTVYLWIEEIIKLFSLEFKLAKSSLLFVFVYSIIFIFLLFSFWLLMLLTCIFLFHHFLNDWLISFLLTAGLNVLFIGVTLWYLRRYSENLRFSHTRKYLFGVKEKNSDDHSADRSRN
jgi:uncharacterized membrane protein YqjE